MNNSNLQLINGISIGIDIFAIAVSLVLAYAVFSESRTKRKISQYFLGILIANAVCAAADCVINFLEFYSVNFRFIGRIYDFTYICFMLTLMFFSFFQYAVMRDKVHIVDGILYSVAFVCCIPVVFWIVGAIQQNPWFYTVNEAGRIVAQPYFWISSIVPMLILVFNFVFMLSCRRQLTLGELFAWISYELFPFGVYVSFFFTKEVHESFLYGSFAISLIFLYIQIHLQELKKGIITENELRKSQMKLMVSQIQPHFMYNALNSIYVLIDQDVETAKEAVSTFSDYLRQNVNALKSEEPVLFEEELEHTRAYLYLEKIRFGQRLQILYDIQATDFLIPPLSVQPLVENAVKHGISQQASGGVLKISSIEEEKRYIITITDNGRGFDAGSFAGDSKHTHVGLYNVNSRLVSMVRGNLNVQSIPGSGTICTITIPKDKKK